MFLSYSTTFLRDKEGKGWDCDKFLIIEKLFESPLFTDFFVKAKLVSCFEFSKRWRSYDVLIPAVVLGLKVSKWLLDFFLPSDSIDVFIEKNSGEDTAPDCWIDAKNLNEIS